MDPEPHALGTYFVDEVGVAVEHGTQRCSAAPAIRD